MIRRLLVANRGEIAIRVMRAARELGIEAVGLYAKGDESAVHLDYCERAVRIEAEDPRSAYLDIEGVVGAAVACGADALHPGYGFLSENPAFARKVEGAGIAFVGPSPSTMEAFGVKTRARALMQEAGVPTVPGTTRPAADPAEAASAADALGYPVALKASHGGGGRGIRIVASPEALGALFETASREAVQAFGNGELYVEKYLDRPRHIEVQVLGDGRGEAVHLFERDCSMQRRNQKLIEESPAPNLDGALRARLLSDALRAAKAANYRSAGTVEFLVVGDLHYFLEVNARLQVEHPVTEAVTGFDLVRAQLLLAGGEAALPAQDAIETRGSAIECRINAEDARANFLPSPGRIGAWEPPGGAGVRVDGALRAGAEVSPHFDSLLAKLIVHAPGRTEAIAGMLRAIDEFVITGVPTTLPFHRFALLSAPFSQGRYSTATVGDIGPLPPPPPQDKDALLLAAALARALRPSGSRGPGGAATAQNEGGPLRLPFGPAGEGWFSEV